MSRFHQRDRLRIWSVRALRGVGCFRCDSLLKNKQMCDSACEVAVTVRPRSAGHVFRGNFGPRFKSAQRCVLLRTLWSRGAFRALRTTALLFLGRLNDFDPLFSSGVVFAHVYFTLISSPDKLPERRLARTHFEFYGSRADACSTTVPMPRTSFKSYRRQNNG